MNSNTSSNRFHLSIAFHSITTALRELRRAGAMAALCLTALVLGFVCPEGIPLLTLTLTGCGGGAGGSGQPPPPPQITLLGAGAWDVTDSGTDWVVAGTPSFLLLLSGKGFTSASVVEWNGAELQTTFTDSTDLAAQVPASLVGSPGTARLTVYDSSEGATSNAITFGIASPAAATAGLPQAARRAQRASP